MDRGAWRATVHGVAKSRTRLTDFTSLNPILASQVVLVVKNPTVKAEDIRDMGSIPGSGRFPEKSMATHSSSPAWRIPQTEEPGGLQSIGSQ